MIPATNSTFLFLNASVAKKKETLANRLVFEKQYYTKECLDTPLFFDRELCSKVLKEALLLFLLLLALKHSAQRSYKSFFVVVGVETWSKIFLNGTKSVQGNKKCSYESKWSSWRSTGSKLLSPVAHYIIHIELHCFPCMALCGLVWSCCCFSRPSSCVASFD